MELLGGGVRFWSPSELCLETANGSGPLDPRCVGVGNHDRHILVAVLFDGAFEDHALDAPTESISHN